MEQDLAVCLTTYRRGKKKSFTSPSDIYLTETNSADLKNPRSENNKCGLHEVTFRSRIYIHRLYLGKLSVIPFLSSIHGSLL